MLNLYIASKTDHSDKWSRLYGKDQDVQLCSRWPMRVGKVDAENPAIARQMWLDNIEDVKNCNGVILYVEPGELHKGSLIELGVALANGTNVAVVGTNESLGSWINQPKVFATATIENAITQLKAKLNGGN